MEISLRQISYFLRLVEKSSFTIAAESLGITQPALSIAISQLEKALEVQLIERGALPVRPTPYGTMFRGYAERICNDLKEARQEIAALGSGMLGRLDIGMGPSAACPEVAAVLTRMIDDFPALEIHVHLGVFPAVAARLHAGDLSLYLGTIAPDFVDPLLAVQRLAALDLAIVTGAAHPLAGRSGVTAADLAQYPLLAMGNLDANLPDWRTVFLDAGLDPPSPAIDVRNIALVRSLLVGGRFITILPSAMVREDLEAGILAAIGPTTFSWSLDLHAVFRKGGSLPAAAAQFLDRVTTEFALHKTI